MVSRQGTSISVGGLILLMAGWIGNAWAVPAEVERRFSEIHPEADVATWDLDQEQYWVASFLFEDFEYRARFEAQGDWIETERAIGFQALPEPLQYAVTEKFPTETLGEVKSVKHHTRGDYYSVAFERPGQNHEVMLRESSDGVEMFEEVGDVWEFLMDRKKERQIDPDELGALELVFELTFNLITILIFACGIYYPRHRDHQMLFLLLGFNLFLFPIFLLSTGFTAGVGFTIFAMLALVRLRSDSFSKTEVAYLLGAVALTFINALLVLRVSIPGAAIVLLTAWLGDHPRVWRNPYQRVHIRFRHSDPKTLLDRSFLKKQVSEDYGIEVDHLEVELIQKDEVRLVVMYRDRSDGSDPDSLPRS